MARLSRAPALAFALILGVAVALSVSGYRNLIAVARSWPGPVDALAAAQVAVAWVFIVAGAVAIVRSTRRWTPLLLIATGLALFVRMLRYSPSPAAFTIGVALGGLNYALMGHAVLSFPDDRVRDRFERAALAVGYVVLVAFPLASLLFFDPQRSCLYCGSRPPRGNLLLIDGSDRVWSDLSRATTLSGGGLAIVFVLLLGRRLAGDTRRGRALSAPLVLAAVCFAARGVVEAIRVYVPIAPSRTVALAWWEYAAEAAIALALLAGLLRPRFAEATMAELLPALTHATAAEVRDVLAHGLADPSLDLLLKAGTRDGFVDVAGRPVETARGDGARTITPIEDEGVLLAVIVHDRSLVHEGDLVATAAAAARLALKNAQLTDELRQQIEALAASRARVVAAADAERRRIERNIHDGAQQRLLGIALGLRNAERAGDKQTLAAAASTAVEELQAAVTELRTLAQGLHPSILSEEGLGAALQSAVRRSPVPVALEGNLQGRLPPEVESTTYFVVSEVLANVAKHSGASAATVRLRHERGLLTVEVEDDGVGGADSSGSGLSGLLARVEAHGGSFHVTSPSGRGTRVVSEIPCAS